MSESVKGSYRIAAILNAVWRIGAAALVISLAAGCHDKPPTGPTPSNGPAPPVVVSLEIAGPASIAPGQSVQFSLLQRLSNGSTQPVSAAHWTSTNRTLLQISDAGLATTAPLYGDTMLQAQIADAAATGPRLATREILVQPDGTFRLVGAVLEAGTGGRRVPGARLEARVDAALSSPIVTFATTIADGTYRVYGVPPDPFIHVRKPGYRSTTMPIQLAAHATRNFDLELDGQRLALAGGYTMTVEAGSSCGGVQPLANDLRRRTYAADIAQDGARLTIILSGAPLAVAGGSGNRFSGIANLHGADVELRSFRDDYFSDLPDHPDVVEALADGTALTITGRAALVQTPTGLSGKLAGAITQYSGSTFPFEPGWRLPYVRQLATCSTTTLTLTPR